MYDCIGDAEFTEAAVLAASSSSSKPSTLLVIDDEPNTIFSIREVLSSPQISVISATNARDGIELVQSMRPNAVILDMRLPDLSGLEAFDRIRKIDPRVPIVFITGFARTEMAIEAISRGAHEYLVKPVDLQRLTGIIGGAFALNRSRQVAARLGKDEQDDLSADRIIGQSAAMQNVYKMIGRVAKQETTVLILGESGTGKELVARAIYQYSQRHQSPFLAINCAALPDSILESELFGHERGAFTGADQRRIGKFEQCNGGTLFLDEIGDMSPNTQAKALRLLQHQQFERIGGNDTVHTDVRIIAATNRDLMSDVAEGRFRKDLLYRLNGFTIVLPPLRDRPEDIPTLASHFVKCLNRELGKQIETIAPTAMELLIKHNWPGNVREFLSAIRFAMVHAPGSVILPECLPEGFRRTDSLAGHVGTASEDSADGPSRVDSPDLEFPFVRLIQYTGKLLHEGDPDIYERVIRAVDRQILGHVMEYFHWNQTIAAERLGVSRMTLRAKLKQFGILKGRQRNEANGHRN